MQQEPQPVWMEIPLLTALGVAGCLLVAKLIIGDPQPLSTEVSANSQPSQLVTPARWRPGESALQRINVPPNPNVLYGPSR